MENECEALPDVAYPGVRDNRSTLNTKTGYDDMMISEHSCARTDSSRAPDATNWRLLVCV